jgi:hypothetical protein
MTIDQRIEALTQSLELLATLHHDLEKMHREQEQKSTARFTETDERLDRLTGLTEALGAGIVAHDNQIGTLVSIVQKHEATLRGLQGH